MKYLVTLALLIGTFSVARAQALSSDRQVFAENKGQWPKEVLFQTRLGGLDAWITKTGIVYDFYRLQKNALARTTAATPAKFREPDLERFGQVVRVSLLGAHAAPRPQGAQRQPGRYNYFTGSDERAWTRDVTLYRDAWVHNVYAGIDLHYYFDEGRLRYDYVLAPGADASQIAMDVQGANGRPAINADGELEFVTRFGAVRQAKLLAYQTVQDKKQPVDCRFALDAAGRVRFALGDYDRAAPLVIDPLVYSTYLGGSGDEAANAIRVDGSGSTYIAGIASTNNFPTTTGAYSQTYRGGSYDATVTKLNDSGNRLIYSTYLGGSMIDCAFALAIDASGNAYVSGRTRSSNFPTTAGSYKRTIGGGDDAFLTKLNDSGNRLVYSTFLGGSGDDMGFCLAVSASGNATLAGIADQGFPTTPGSYNQTFAGGLHDCFVARVDAGGSNLTYSTYLGGDNDDWPYGMVSDAAGNLYLGGSTASGNFPTTPGSYSRSYSGSGNSTDFDGFALKLNAAGTALVYGTYLGGTDVDYVEGVSVDGSGNAYLAGNTASANFPTTSGSYRTVYGGGAGDGFVTKLNAAGSALVYSTFLGESGTDDAHSVQVDVSGNALISGETSSSNFPTTSGSYSQTFSGGSDGFAVRLNATGTALSYSTLLGGSGNDGAISMFVDVSGDVYIGGNTLSSDFPTTAGCYDPSFNGGGTFGDGFVTKLNTSRCGATTAVVRHNDTLICQQPGARYQWLRCNANGIRTLVNGATQQRYRPPTPGTFCVAIIVNNNCRDTSTCQSVALSVENARSGDRAWSVRPNPNRGSFLIATETPSVFELFDMTGRKIATYEVKGASLEVREPLSAGLYLLREQSSGATQKILVE